MISVGQLQFFVGPNSAVKRAHVVASLPFLGWLGRFSLAHRHGLKLTNLDQNLVLTVTTRGSRQICPSAFVRRATFRLSKSDWANHTHDDFCKNPVIRV